MKEITINADTWHYGLAKIGGYDRDESSDLCALIRAQLKGTILLLVMAVTASCMTAAIGLILFYMSYGWYQLYVLGILNPVFIVAWPSICITGVVYLIFRINKRLSDRPPSPPSYISTAYSSFKEKTCYRIKIINND